MQWSVNVGMAGMANDEQVDDLLTLLAAHQPAVSFAPDTIGARIWIDDASDALAAARAASKLVTAAVKQAGIAAATIIELHAAEAARFEAELENPSIPELVGAAEAEKMLGVSRQRFHEIRRAGPSVGFPEPLLEVAATPLWTRAGVQAFLKRWARKPGRPSGLRFVAQRDGHQRLHWQLVDTSGTTIASGMGEPREDLEALERRVRRQR